MTSVDDVGQLALASAQGWLLMTHNARHFRSLHRTYQDRGEPHGGIAILPERPPFERLVVRATMMLAWIGGLAQWQSRLFTWGRLQQRFEAGEALEAAPA
jgi:hypothetical protein